MMWLRTLLGGLEFRLRGCKHPRSSKPFVSEIVRFAHEPSRMEVCWYCGSIRMQYTGETPGAWLAPLMWRQSR